jgi:hypothetical protein
MTDTRDQAEKEAEAQDMIEEMGFCKKCRDHKPCGCEKGDKNDRHNE